MEKHFGILMTLAVAAVLTACTKSDDVTQLSIGGEDTVWNADVTQHMLQVRCDGRWTAESNVSWCDPLKSSGNGDTQLPLWVSPNLTGTARTGVLTISTGNNQQKVTLRQPAFSGSLDDYEYRLPVVFHVLYKDKDDENQYAGQEHMEKILAGVNKLYAQNGMHVTFEMARYNDDGDELEERGIVRHEVDFDDYDPSLFLAHDNEDNRQYARYAQNLKKYINVFIFRFKQTLENRSAMGLTRLPIMPTVHPMDSLMTTDAANNFAYVRSPWGCCINNEFIYEWQDDESINPNYIVTIIAHELGHYLGLLHTFSMDECNMDDACFDTNICDYMNYVDYITAYIRQKQEAGVTTFSIADLARRNDCKTAEEYTAHNIMDYAYCYNDEFTNQQRKRIRQVLWYSPLVPGPKLISYETRGNANHNANVNPNTQHSTLHAQHSTLNTQRSTLNAQTCPALPQMVKASR
ncbi:MAG: zinc-dependent metalloproteinase lipoprotein [Prevotella sp.]|nr:zinc-dependent metalloproteinase lipoprotein [Prevotella sp.]